MSLTFQQFIDNEHHFKVYLVKIRPYQEITGFTLHSGAVYKKTVTDKIVHCRQNLVAMTAGASASLSAGQWFYDSSTEELYVRMLDDSSPSGSNVYAYHYLYFSTYYSPELGDPDNNYWTDQIKNIPEITRGRSGTLSRVTTTFGKLKFFNGDNYWKDKWNSLKLDFVQFEIYLSGFVFKVSDRTKDWLPWANKKTILKGLCKRESYSDKEVIFKLGEIFDFFASTFPLTEYSTSTYSNLDTGATGRSIHRGYGILKGIEAVEIDTTNYTYKFDDQAVTSIDAVYDSDGTTLSTSSTSTTNATVTLSSSTNKTVYVDYTKTVGTSSRAGSIKLEILQNVLGIATADIDTAAYSTLDTDRPYTLGISIPSKKPILDIFKEINESVLAEDNVNRDGQFTTKKIVKASSGDANQQTYTDYLNVLGEPQFDQNIDNLANRILIGYDRDHSKEEANQYKFQSVDALGNEYELVKVLTIPTALRSSSDATAIGTAYVPFLNAPETQVKFKTTLKPFSQWVGETIKYDRPAEDDGPSGGSAYWKILRIRENYSKGTTEIIGVN